MLTLAITRHSGKFQVVIHREGFEPRIEEYDSRDDARARVQAIKARLTDTRQLSPGMKSLVEALAS